MADVVLFAPDGGSGVAARPKVAGAKLRVPAWLLFVVATVVISAGVGVSVWALAHAYAPAPAPSPSAPYDPAFVPLGRGYGQGPLAERYADAWEDGAKLLDAGQPPSAALDTVAKAWEHNRTALFDKVLTPAFAKVVPESKDPVTAEDRAALAKAWRGVAHGLRGGR